MEPRTVTCSCGKTLRIPDDYRKPVARCPACKNIIQIENSSAPLDLVEPDDPEGYLRKVVGACQVCGKPVTLAQREKFGYYCDETCLQRGKDLFHPVIPTGEEVVEEQARNFARSIWAGAAAFVVIVAASLAVYLPLRGHAKVKWRHPLDSGVVAIEVSPRLICFTEFDGTLYALDARRGKLLWKHETEETGMSAAKSLPTGDVCLTSRGSTIQALHWRTGGLVWERNFGKPPLEVSTDSDEQEDKLTLTAHYQFDDHDRAFPLISVDNNTVIVLSGGSDLGFPFTRFSGYFGASEPSQKKLSALDLTSGQPRWEMDLGQTAPLGIAAIGGAVGLALPDESDYQSLNLTVIDASTGRPISDTITLKSAASSLEEGHGFCATEGKVFTYFDKHLKCINVATHREEWSQYVGNLIDGPIFEDGRLFFTVASDVMKVPPEAGTGAESLASVIAGDYEEPPIILTCLDADNGHNLWEQEVVHGSLICAGGNIISFRSETRQPVGKTPANQDYFFAAYSTRTGKRLWESNHKGVVTTSLESVGEMVYYGAHDLKMARTSLVTGTITQEGPMNHRIMAVRMR